MTEKVGSRLLQFSSAEFFSIWFQLYRENLKIFFVGTISSRSRIFLIEKILIMYSARNNKKKKLYNIMYINNCLVLIINVIFSLFFGEYFVFVWLVDFCSRSTAKNRDSCATETEKKTPYTDFVCVDFEMKFEL